MYGVRESRQGGADHQLVLVLVRDQVEDEVQRVSIYGQPAVVKDDVSCFMYDAGGGEREKISESAHTKFVCQRERSNMRGRGG